MTFVVVDEFLVETANVEDESVEPVHQLGSVVLPPNRFLQRIG
jgi:hypothetical protein